MARLSTSNVPSAFEILLEEIRRDMQELKQAGARAFEAEEFETVAVVAESSKALKEFVKKVETLRDEWKQLAAATDQTEQPSRERRNLGRIRKGARTPEKEFFIPILKVLVRMGGEGRIGDVLEEVGRLMQPHLKPVDMDPLPSKPELPRWRNTARWARNSMVNQGLLERNTPRGVWRISAEGRSVLERWKTEQRHEF